MSRAVLLACAAVGLAACSRDAVDPDDAKGAADAVRMPSVTVSGDDSSVDELNWRPPAVTLAPEGVADAHRRAAAALSDGRLFDTADDAIPLYLALLRLDPADARARRGLDRSLDRLLEQGRQTLRHAEDRTESLRRARQIAAVARTVAPGDTAVATYLARVDEADQLTRLNVASERALREGRLGEAGGGALAGFREVLKWKPGQPRALQGVAAVESAMIRRAEEAAHGSDFATARRWLDHAAQVRQDAQTVADARVRVEYVASDAERQTIPYVRVTDARGTREYVAEGADPASLAAGERRVMDCADCHNGVGHPIAPTVEKAVNAALADGRLDRALPFIRREAVRTLSADYPDQAAAEDALDGHKVRLALERAARA